LPAGIAADVFGPHIFLGSSIVLWSLMMGMQAWAPTVAALAWVRIVFGAAQAGAFSALAKITRNWFPLNSRTSVQGWVGITFGRAGAASANFLLATVMIGMLGLPWRTSFWILAGLGIALGVAFLLIFRNTPRVHPWANEAETKLIEGPATRGPTVKLTAAQLFKQLRWSGLANLLTLNLQTLLSNAADILYQAWIPLYLVETHNLDYKQMGIFSAFPLLGGAVGGALGGWLNDYFSRRNRRWGRSLVGLVGKAGAAALLMVAVAFSDNPYLFCSLLFFVKLIGDWSLASTWGTVTDIGGPASATVFGINNAVGNVGAVVAPLIYGYVAMHYGWTPVFISVAAIYLLCAASWLLVDCTRPLLQENQAAE
jgi:MFS family permease